MDLRSSPMAAQLPRDTTIGGLRDWVTNQWDVITKPLDELKSALKTVATISEILWRLEETLSNEGKVSEPAVVELLLDIKHMMYLSAKKVRSQEGLATLTLYRENTLKALDRWFADSWPASAADSCGPSFAADSSELADSSWPSFAADNELNLDKTWLFVQLFRISFHDKFIAVNISSITDAESITGVFGEFGVEGKPPVVLEFESDVRKACYTSAESSIFVYGGEVSRGSNNYSIRKCNAKQFLETPALESTPKWLPLTSSNSPVPLLCQFTLLVGQKFFLFGIAEQAHVKSTSSAYMYDLQTSKWSDVANPTPCGWLPLDFFSWTNWEGKEELIVVLLKERRDGESLYCVQEELKLLHYSFEKNEWDFFSYLECSAYGGRQQFVVVDNILFHIRGVKWRVYNLMQKESKGFVKGLERLLEMPGIYNLEEEATTHGFNGVANLPTSSSSCLQFCAGWESYGSPRHLQFAFIRIKDQGDYFCGQIYSFGRVQLDAGYHVGKFGLRLGKVEGKRVGKKRSQGGTSGPQL